MDELYQQIIDAYKETESVKRTAEILHTYPIKVRRVLITEGLWHSKTSDQIMELLNEGLSVSEIAEKLVISEKNVQSYMPYRRGQYGGEDRSDEAIRSEAYRDRMQKAAKNQVTKTEARSKNQDTEMREQKKLLEELRTEYERLLVEKQEIWNQIEKEMQRIPLALELHLELDMEGVGEEEIDILKKYGRMEKSISRDFIVPGAMTLHGLHYAILKAFGWQNSHLHSYIPTEEEFKLMTDGGKVSEWTRQVGVYFRFPTGNFEDIYWDDDYEEDMSFKSWLRSKYCGPYIYGGTDELYLIAQNEVEHFGQEYPEIQDKSTDQREWGVFFEGQCEELIERSLICSVLRTPAEEVDWDNWRQEKEELLRSVEPQLGDNMQKLADLIQKMEQISEERDRHLSKNKKPDMDVLRPIFEQIDKVDSDIDMLLFANNAEPIPALSNLIYRYDYGDGWEIKITCTNAWFDRSGYAHGLEGILRGDRNGSVREKSLYVDAFGKEVDGELLEKILSVAKKEKPVCTAWDGMNLVDDVGGIHGFCEFLETINGDDPEEKKFNKTWARSLGWTGRMSKPENVL